jgi:hypothetical protein
LTLLTFYGLGEDLGTAIVTRTATGMDLSVLLALANMAILAWWLYRWIRPLPVFSGARHRAAGTTEARAHPATESHAG